MAERGEAGAAGGETATGGEAATAGEAATGGDAAHRADTKAAADGAPDEPPPATDPGAVVADLHARAVVLREHVGWPSGEALASMPTFRETVDAVLAKDLPDDALRRIGTDNDEFVASVGLAALVERDALPGDWTDTAVRRLRRSGTQDEHFLLLTLVTVPGRVIGRVLEQNRHISDAGIAWFLEQRVAAGEPVDAETFSADVRAVEADELDRIFDEEPDVPESVRTAFREWKDSLGEAELRRYLGRIGKVWDAPFDAPPASLVGDRAELVERMAEALAEVPPRSLVLVGEHGVGKSALLRAALDRLTRAARRVRGVRGDDQRRRHATSASSRAARRSVVERLRSRNVVWVLPQPGGGALRRTALAEPAGPARRAAAAHRERRDLHDRRGRRRRSSRRSSSRARASRARSTSSACAPLGERESIGVVRHALAGGAGVASASQATLAEA